MKPGWQVVVNIFLIKALALNPVKGICLKNEAYLKYTGVYIPRYFYNIQKGPFLYIFLQARISYRDA